MITWTKTPNVIPLKDIPISLYPNKYSVSFWIYVDNWYHNHALWRSVIYQGTKPSDDIHLTTWGDVITKIPKQRFGVWLAPYTNNLRCVIGTNVPFDSGISTTHPVTKICKGNSCNVNVNKNSNKYYYELEHIDIKNIDIGIPFMVTMVIDILSLGIYINGKLRHNVKLDGMPVSLNADCFVKPEKSFDGHLMEVRLWEKNLSSKKVNERYNMEYTNIMSLVNDKES